MLVATAIAAGVLAAPAAWGDAAPGAIIADLSFDDAATGLTGGGATASVTGALSLAPGVDGTQAVSLSSSGWLSLTKTGGTPLLAGLDAVTFSYDSAPSTTSNTGWAIFAAPSTTTQTYQNEHYVGVMDKASSLVVERYNNSGTRVSTGNLTASSTVAGWKHVDLVLSGASAQLYVDGSLVASNASGVALSTILGSAGGILQIGKANWVGGEYFTGLLDNLTVYSTALTQAQIQQNLVDSTAAQLPTSITIAASSYVLPGAAGVVTWSSATPAIVIGADGRSATVTRPPTGSAPTTGTLTATVALGSQSQTREVAVSITAPPSDAELARQDLDAIVIPGLSDVRTSLTLPTTGTVNGSAITWTSSAPDAISAGAADGPAAGVVVRGATAREVTLTASVNGYRRAFAATVRAAVADPAPTDYLFAHFTGTEGSVTAEQIYFATSGDGVTWTDTRANSLPVLSSVIGDRGVRDPYLVRSPEGDHFTLIATDLSIYYRGGWGSAAATTTGSLKLVVWESDDLAHWTRPRLVDVASAIPGAGMAWAPEAFWDDVAQQYVVYWATGSDTTNDLGDRTNVYYATTRDFTTFSAPVKWIDRTGSIIDTTMIKVGDWYYRASGDGQITIERSKNLYAITTAATAPAYVDDQHWSLVGTLSSIFGTSNYSGAKLEGPEFFEYNPDDWPTGTPTWGLMADQYAAGTGYLPFRTTAIGTATTGSWSTASDVNFGTLKKRHGTILPITATELAAVQSAAVGTTGDLATIAVADPMSLASAVDDALDLAAADYTPASWAPVADALARAHAVLADPLATQSTTDAARTDLTAARSQLVAVETPDPGDDGSTPTPTPTPTGVDPTPVPAVTLGTPTFSATKRVYGAAARTTVSVAVGGVATGEVVFREGSAVLGIGTISGGRATATLSAVLPVGRHVVTATFAGAGTTATSVASAVLTVSKASVRSLKIVTAKRYRTGGSATVKVVVASTLTSGARTTGHVRIRVGSTTVRTVTIAALARAKGAVVIPAKYLRSSKATVTATFLPKKPATVASRSAKTTVTRR